MNMLDIKGLKKCFGEKQVLCGLDLTVPEHSIFGFIGQNGSGKTTTMKAVLGLLAPDAGEIYVAGEKVTFGQTPTNRHIGYLPDVPEFYGFMTAAEYLDFCGQITGMAKSDRTKRTAELLELVGLGGERHRIKGFSRGMKQRLGIAQALYNRPKLLICDEPTSALDPVGRKEILDILQAARAQTTVLFSTHILSDVERICTDVALLHGGHIALGGKPAELAAAGASDAFVIEVADAEDASTLVGAFGCCRPLTEPALDGSRILCTESEMLSDILRFIADHHLQLQKIERQEPTLESLFLEATKNQTRKGEVRKC